MSAVLGIFITILYLASILLCVGMMQNKDIEPGCLSMLCVITLILNTVLAILFITKKNHTGKNKLKEFWEYEKKLFVKIFTFKDSEE